MPSTILTSLGALVGGDIRELVADVAVASHNLIESTAASIRPVFAISTRMAVLRRSIVALSWVVKPERRHVMYAVAAAVIAASADSPDSHEGNHTYQGLGPLVAVSSKPTPRQPHLGHNAIGMAGLARSFP
jgi:hypothetical protein